MSNIEQELHEIDKNVVVLKQQVSTMQKQLDELVTRAEFAPVKLIAYGLATAVMSSVLMAILAKVVITQ